MTNIQIAVEGEGAVPATEALLAMPELSGSWAPAVNQPTREGVTATIATIVGIVGGSLAIAEQLRKWYEAYKKEKSGKRIEKVLLVGRNGRRLLLENATLEELRQILED